MLPHINAENWHFTLPHDWILILRRNDGEPLLFARLNLHKPSPAASLDPQQRGFESIVESLFIAPGGLDLLDKLWCSRSLGFARGDGGEVLPKERVVDVASSVELDRSLKRNL